MASLLVVSFSLAVNLGLGQWSSIPLGLDATDRLSFTDTNESHRSLTTALAALASAVSSRRVGLLSHPSRRDITPLVLSEPTGSRTRYEHAPPAPATQRPEIRIAGSHNDVPKAVAVVAGLGQHLPLNRRTKQARSAANRADVQWLHRQYPGPQPCFTDTRAHGGSAPCSLYGGRPCGAAL